MREIPAAHDGPEKLLCWIATLKRPLMMMVACTISTEPSVLEEIIRAELNYTSDHELLS